MTLITPSNLQHILGLSITSRLVIIGLQYLANIVLSDHSADAYRNKYYKVLTEDKQLAELLPNSYRYLYKSIEGFTKWDAQYFLEISKDGYTSEQHLAFLPFFPMLISFTRQVLFGHSRLSFSHFLPLQPTDSPSSDQNVSVADLENYIQAALVGVTLNNFILFPAACIFLFALTKLIKGDDERYAKTVVCWFCINPASIFFSSCYSESLYAALTFMAMFIIEYRFQKYLHNHSQGKRKPNTCNFEPLSHLNRLIYIFLPALVPMALASATRSNALVSIGFITYHFLIKYAPLVIAKLGNWTLLAYISFILECIQDVLVLLMSSILAASGYISFQIYSYIKFCVNEANSQKGAIISKPLWCDNVLPHPYGQVQAKYWNVGIFSYYQLKQLPNFLLATPISYLVIAGSLSNLREMRKKISSVQNHQLAYYIQAISLTLLCSVSINIQVVTRLLVSSCPVVFWICADLTKSNRNMTRILLTYCLAYFSVGTVLHANFYPWT